MSEEIFDNEFDDVYGNENERPPFLTVLIILTWLAAGMTVLTSMFSIINLGNSADQLEQSMAVFENMPNSNPLLREFMKDYKEFTMVAINNLIPIHLSMLVLYLLEGFAALLMFNLKKIGFWIYLVCQAGFLIVVFSFYPSGNYMTTITLISGFIFSALFAMLYGFNLKHLKN